MRGVGSRQERTEGKKVSLTFCTQKTLGLFCFYFALFCPRRKIKKVDGSSQSVKGTGSFLCFNILITFTQAGPWVNANANAFVRLLWLRWINRLSLFVDWKKKFCGWTKNQLNHRIFVLNYNVKRVTSFVCSLFVPAAVVAVDGLSSAWWWWLLFQVRIWKLFIYSTRISVVILTCVRCSLKGQS